MVRIQKAFRLSEEAIHAIEERDRSKYRTAQEYIEALILHSDKKTTIETLAYKIDGLEKKISTLKEEMKRENEEQIRRLETLFGRCLAETERKEQRRITSYQSVPPDEVI